MEEFFRCCHKVRMDDKGRVKVPQEFLSIAKSRYDGSETYFVTSTDGKLAHAYSLGQWKAIERKISALETPSPVFRKYLKLAYFYGQEVKLDSAGRMLMPPILREKLGLKDEIAVIGAMDHYQFMNWSAYDAEIASLSFSEEEDRELIATLGVMS